VSSRLPGPGPGQPGCGRRDVKVSR